ncbi:MAG TPA: serine hydrolase domain-containing protein [Anaeromyxobacteraceae bacterium]|nr:serine hydrolase domain-containing protein [Anaeromyxobacteraceae bacterium]
MPRLVFVASAAALFAGCASLPPREDARRYDISSARLQRLAATVREDVQQGRYPGAVAMIARNGALVFAEAFGVQNPKTGAPMKVDSIFRIASMTKPMVSVGAMTLVEDGLVQLGDPVSKYLPELKGLKVGIEKKDASGHDALEEIPAQREMTVQDLLRHTSGLTYSFFGRSAVKQKYVEAKVDGDSDQTNAELVRRLSKLPLAYQPGTTWEYGRSTDVLGALIERVSGQTLDVFLADRILKPLRMKDTGFYVDPSQHGRIAEPFDVDPDSKAPARVAAVLTQPKLLSGGSGMVSTAGDYLRFAQMLLNGGELDGARILSRKTVELMTSDHLGPGTARTALYFPGPGYGFGLGFAVRTAAGESPSPGSIGDYFWVGYYGTLFFVDPKEKLIGIWMMQRVNLPANQVIWRRYKSQVYAAIE